MNVTRFLVAMALLAVTSVAQATTYNYSYTFDDGTVVSGSFDGTASYNLITGLSNISAFYNGLAFIGNTTLQAYSYNGTALDLTGTPQASFNGTQNNLLFTDMIDKDAHNAFGFYMLGGSPVTNAAFFGAPPNVFQENSISVIDYPEQYDAGRWQVSAVDTTAPVPEPGTIALLGLGMAGLAIYGKRRQSKA